MELLKFGDIFRYKEKEYVFLVKTEELIYVAKILNKTETDMINNLYEIRSERKENCIDMPLFCYVILQTNEFKGRMAHFHKPGNSDCDICFDKLNVVLDKEDLVAIKKEIENPNSPIDNQLKALIKNINI